MTYQGGRRIENFWREVMPLWPLRLLYIPTMTSLQRSGESTYGGVDSPKYAILTYTWGRFRAAWGSPALEVDGVTWKVPPIQARHFTVDAFQKLIAFMGQRVDFAWIDVCCIDQEDRATKMFEVGRQAGIFKQATNVYAWLNYHAHDQLQELFDIIFDLDSVMAGWDICKLSEDQKQSVLPKLQRILTSLQSLIQDPWFTSLWTLQEAVLRRDAMIMSTEGRPLTLGFNRKHNIRLEMFCNLCWNMLANITGFAKDWPSEAIPLTQRIQHLIRKSGLFFTMTNNPNVQYGMTRHRVTRHPLDRVYAVMQIYGFRLGEFIRPGIPVTLDDLEVQLAEQLTLRSPMLSQWFVHTALPAVNRSWMISQRSHVPDELILYQSYGDNTILRVFGTIQPTSKRTAIFFRSARPLLEMDVMCRKELHRFHAMFFALDAQSPEHSDIISEPHRSSSNTKHIPQGSFRDKFEQETSRSLNGDVLTFLLGDSSSVEIPFDFHRTYAVILVKDQRNNQWKRMGLIWWDTIHCIIKPDYHEFFTFEAEIH